MARYRTAVQISGWNRGRHTGAGAFPNCGPGLAVRYRTAVRFVRPSIEHPRALRSWAMQLELPAALRLDAGPPTHRVTAAASVAVLRGQGHTYGETARRLNAAGVPTPSGLVGRWVSATVRRVEHPDRYAAYMREYRRTHR